VTTELELDFILPGNPQTKTGGYIYDHRIIEGLTKLGWRVTVHSFDSSFPFPTKKALARARVALNKIRSGNLVLIDGLALGGMPTLLDEQKERLRLAALVHHPLALDIGLSPQERKIMSQSEKKCLSTVKQIFVTSQWTKEQIVKLHIPSNKVEVVVPGTDKAALAHGSKNALIRILCVATLTSRKGHSILFDALEKLPTRSWHLYCVGSLEREVRTVKKLRAQLTRLRLNEHVTLLGEVNPEALSKHYDGADLFVLASHLEGYGMVLSEAIARGLPVICTSAGAIPMTPAADAALLVPEGNRLKLSKALLEVINNEKALKMLAKKSRVVRNNLPIWNQSCNQFSSVLREIS
jgi:glycosyltransferase involved in cell wall biosynthesis